MGQSTSKSFKVNGQPKVDGGSKLSICSKGLLRDATFPQCSDNVSSKSTATTEDSQSQQKPASLEDAIRSANMFFNYGSSPWSLQRLSQTGNNQRSQAEQQSHHQQQRQPVDTLVESRTRSRPVPVKGAPRHQESSQGHQLELGHDYDFLKELYELRTWDMYVRITEARKRQRFGNGGDNVQDATGSLMAEMEPNPLEAPPAPVDVPPDHQMIFSCDLE